MEEKKNTGLVVALVIFILISLGLGGFICYDKLMNKESNSSNNEPIQQTNENNTAVEANTKKDAYQVLALSPIDGHAVVYNGEVYVNVYDSTTNIDSVYGEGKFQTLVKTRNSYKQYDFGNLNVVVDGSNKWLKLNVADVKAVYNNEYGQALSSTNPKYGIIILNSDSTVSYISIKDLIESNVNPTKLDATNISSIKTEDNDGYTTYLVKADGTKIDVNTLIK